jgi:preprotein translocase subunit SecB
MSAKTTAEKMQKVIQAATLIDIALKSSSVDMLVPARSVSPSKTRLDFDRSHNFIAADDKSLLVCFVGLKIVAFESVEGSEEKKSLFKMDATYTLVYRLTGEELDHDALDLFTSQNAYFNAYPYLREFFQNTCVRMGVEPIRLPLLKPLTKKELDQQAEKA